MIECIYSNIPGYKLRSGPVLEKIDVVRRLLGRSLARAPAMLIVGQYCWKLETNSASGSRSSCPTFGGVAHEFQTADTGNRVA